MTSIKTLDVQFYLDRLDDHETPEPTAETLRRLHLAHLLTVPFENLSIHMGEPIVLETKALFDKIVRRRRGGFCYELNGLFAALLRTLGFRVDMLSAGVANSEGRFGPEFDHMTLLVHLQQRWLADVGFGDSFRQPLLLDESGAQIEGEKAYRLTRAGDYFTLMRRDGLNSTDPWQAQYRFTLQPHTLSDYIERCYYHQTSPESTFTQKRVCSKATPTGRVTLSDRRFIMTSEDGTRNERELQDEKEVTCILRDYFGINLT